MDLYIRYSIWHSQIFQRDEIEIADFDSHFEPDRPAYIYCILAKNRIKIDNKSISFTDKYIKTEFAIHDKDELKTENINLKHDYKDLKEVKIISDFPHNQFYVVDEFENKLIFGKASYFLEHESIYEQVVNKDLLDYEILYIGQSVLSDSNVPVLNRTFSHKTYQHILEDYSRNNPDKELFSFFFSFKQDLMIYFPEEIKLEERSKFKNNFMDVYFNNTNENIKQNVSLLEATLIHFFKPKYNDKFVNNPPNKSHVSFGRLNEMNLCQVNVLFAIEDYFPRFYTNTVGRKSEYFIEYLIN